MFGSDYLAMSVAGVMSKSADLTSWDVQAISGYANEGGRTFIKATATKLYIVELISGSSTVKVYEVNSSFVASLIHSGASMPSASRCFRRSTQPGLRHA